MEDDREDWRWIVVAWSIAVALLVLGLIAANFALPDLGLAPLTIGAPEGR
jgi:hypothetical protein